MNAFVDTINTTVRNTGRQSGDYYSVFDAQRVLRTDVSPCARPSPETRVSQVITWEPVILPLLERLTKLRWLPEDQRWPSADWPHDEAFLDAGEFTEQLPVPLNAVPHISLADDGEVNFSWSQNGLRIDLGFYGTGTYSFYARDKTGKEWFGDNISATSPLPKELRRMLAR